jgi:hypothetical protein
VKIRSGSFSALLVGALLVSCRKDPPPPDPPPAPSSASSAAPSASETTFDASSAFSAVSGGLTRLECEGIAPIEEAGTCASAPRPTDALVRFSEKLAELFGMHHPPEPEWWEPARAALAAAQDADAKAMTFAERVSVQNAALHVAVTAPPDLAKDALKIVDRLAFTPAERAAAPTQKSDLSAWLGPPSERTERTKTAPFLHQQASHDTRFFRLVKTPRLRANFSELVAIDTDGAPFVTAVVGSLEIRAGRALDAPACVALQSMDRVRCGAFDGLRDPSTLAEMPGGHFLRRDERGHLRCNDCHGPGGDSPLVGAIDLAPQAVDEDLGFRRHVLVTRLRAQLDSLRRGDKKR